MLVNMCFITRFKIGATPKKNIYIYIYRDVYVCIFKFYIHNKL